MSLKKLGVKELSSAAQEYYHNFKGFLMDDLNIPRALALIWDLLKDNDISDNEKYILVVDFDTVLGLKLDSKLPVAEEIPSEVVDLAQKREVARKEKNWSESDVLRDKINDLGFEIADTSNGFELKKK